ncbi:proline--tRNA ligase [uncultured Peptoniphilus sp.]|uniref:proline--tRNA ligase n=1 Tax=uncultured Peptoniphilus sp. TaxID=254354 RepID=UPI002805EE25|nr:proline--tRNA ligase [uncultured Peptoniphilus sp.]
MRLSKLYMPTLREDPADAEIVSHKFLLRAGFIRKSASGIYTYLPLGYRVVRKIENLVREVMDEFGSQEILMSAIQPREIWEASGRWEKYGPEMFKLKDRHDRDFCLGPTAEEYFTTLVKDEVNSYKDLPLNLYQIQTKYRDEKRPRFGINRSREFSMKDAYTFDENPEKMQEAYMNMYKAYEKVFDKLALNYKIVEGDNGAMGGSGSHEFIALADTGEGVIAFSESGKYAATEEKAPISYDLPPEEEIKNIEKVHTPSCSTIEDLSKFLNISKKRCAKAIDLMIADKRVIVFIPGDRQLNLIKLVSFLGVAEHNIQMMSDEDIKACDSYPGFTGPYKINKDVKIIVDKSLTKIQNLVVGANEKDYHYINVNFKRDFEGEICDDLLLVEEGDTIPGTDEKYKFARGIEVGNIFKLGTKYSKALNATYLDENGKANYFYMGSYGIGITRSVAAIVEQNYDENGIIWPLGVAPYEAIITVINPKNEDQLNLGEKIYKELQDKKIEVLIDDRDLRAGVKFKDRDLIGIPLRITVGKRAGENIVEYSLRKDGEKIEISSEEAIDNILREVENGRL